MIHFEPGNVVQIFNRISFIVIYILIYNKADLTVTSYNCSQHMTHDVSNDSSELVTTKPSVVCLSMETSSCVYEGDFKHYSPMEAHNGTTPHTRKRCWASIVISVGCIVFILSLFKIFVSCFYTLIYHVKSIFYIHVQKFLMVIQFRTWDS